MGPITHVHVPPIFHARIVTLSKNFGPFSNGGWGWLETCISEDSGDGKKLKKGVMLEYICWVTVRRHIFSFLLPFYGQKFFHNYTIIIVSTGRATLGSRGAGPPKFLKISFTALRNWKIIYKLFVNNLLALQNLRKKIYIMSSVKIHLFLIYFKIRYEKQKIKRFFLKSSPFLDPLASPNTKNKNLWHI